MREQIVQAKADLAAEKDRMAAERAALDAQAYKLMLDQNASQAVLKRKHRSRLPLGFDPRNLFHTPELDPVIRRSTWRQTGLRHQDQGRWSNLA